MNISEADVPPLVLALDGFPRERALPRRAIEVSAAVRSAVAVRDLHVCRWCGFRSRKYQEAVPLAGHPRDVEQIVTACLFCHQCFFLQRVRSQRSGVLIWLPEIDQQALNLTTREIYIARLRTGPTAELARALLARLLARRDAAREHLGGLDIDEIGGAGDAQARDTTTRVNRPGIRLLPLDRRILQESGLEFNQFPQALAYWRSREGPYPGADAATPWLVRHARLLA